MNWQEIAHSEQEANVGALSVQLNDCQSSEQTLFTSYIIGCLNINSLRTKILGLKETLHKVPIDIFCIDETKLHEIFPDAQVMIEKYPFPPFRRDRNKKGGGKWFLLERNC